MKWESHQLFRMLLEQQFIGGPDVMTDRYFSRKVRIRGLQRLMTHFMDIVKPGLQLVDECRPVEFLHWFHEHVLPIDLPRIETIVTKEIGYMEENGVELTSFLYFNTVSAKLVQHVRELTVNEEVERVCQVTVANTGESPAVVRNRLHHLSMKNDQDLALLFSTALLRAIAQRVGGSHGRRIGNYANLLAGKLRKRVVQALMSCSE